MKDERTKKPRRQRVDSPAGVAAALISGGKKIKLPEGTDLAADERRVFTELCDEFSKIELTAHKIRLLVILARQMAMLAREQATLMREGFSLINSHGNAFPNPRAAACSQLNSSILAMRRSLGIHTRALEGGSNQKAAVRRAHNKANEVLLDDMDDEDLLPRPNVVPLRAVEEDSDDDGE